MTQLLQPPLRPATSEIDAQPLEKESKKLPLSRNRTLSRSSSYPRETTPSKVSGAQAIERKGGEV